MSSTEKRLTQLEEEVRQLREEIQLLKGEKPEAKKFTVSEPIQPKKSPPVMKQQIEKPKLPDEQEVVVPKKTKQTPEELLSRWLPRVFMVVLVLGVLWGKVPFMAIFRYGSCLLFSLVDWCITIWQIME